MTKEKFFKSIKKRDGRIVPFDESRITNAIFKAMRAAKEGNKSNALLVCGKVIVELKKLRLYDEIPTIEEIQDIVETELILTDFPKTAKAYILYRREHEIKRLERVDILEGKTTNLPFTTNALHVLAKRYLARDKQGQIQENPEQMFDRVARSLANVEEKYNKNKQEIQGIYENFLEAMVSFKYLPAGRTLANAGAETLGFPFHLIRPAGVSAVRCRGIASGPISFLHVYNAAFSVIKQQSRHGANMAIMRVDHPDVLDFMYSKKIEGVLKNFNISIGLTNDFMESVVKNNRNPWMCEFNGVKMKPRIIERDRNEKIIEIREVNMTAREIMDEIV
ncbi:MAG: Ribonucleoside-diphosphate reductase, partial [Parcubacteria group bacterium GW2011_GWA2_31_28]